MQGARKADATGRSTGRTLHRGRVKKWEVDGPFIMHPRYLLASPAYRVLNTPARHVLDFLELEQLNNGGAENGRLLAPYSQLVRFGVSGRDIRPAFTMLDVFGLVRSEKQGERLGGLLEASQYRLTWLPFDHEPPTDDFKRVSKAEVAYWLGQFAAEAKHKRTRQEANRELAVTSAASPVVALSEARKARQQPPTSQDIDSTPQLSSGMTDQLTGKTPVHRLKRQSIEGWPTGQMRGGPCNPGETAVS